MENKYDCPSELWAKFSDYQKELYNQFTKNTIDGKDVFCPDEISQKTWGVVVHNMACHAALLVQPECDHDFQPTKPKGQFKECTKCGEPYE